jgi:hypothetical protein
MLMDFIQGKVSDADVRQNISHAWNVCKRSAENHLTGQGIMAWPFHGSIRTAYGNFLLLKKQQPPLSEHQVVNFEAPKQHQRTIDAYYGPSGSILDVDSVLEIAEREYVANDDHIPEFQLEHSNSSGVRPPETCYICPKCPDDIGKGRDLIVYNTSKTLWQHWDVHHGGEPKPPLWQVHLVSGMKVGNSRTAPWLRLEHARSFHSKDYTIKHMREQIFNGNRVLEKGTYVELQPNLNDRLNGNRWFAEIRDSRVINDQLLVQFCETNCQTLSEGGMERVYVESILRVGSGPHIPFSDVPVSTPQKRDGASNSAKQEFEHHSTPEKRSRQNTPAHSDATKSDNLQKSPAPKQHKQTRLKQAAESHVSPSQHNEEESAGVTNEPRTQLAQSSPIQPPQRPATSPSQHENMMQEIQAHIAKSTRKDAEALNLFQAASRRLTNAGWSRCKTVEQSSAWANIQHPDYKVLETPRDGKCMYHCFLRILKAERELHAPNTPQDLRKELARYVGAQVPPEGISRGPHGGIFANGDPKTYLHLEEALESTYGGEAALAVFVQLYDVTIHCHAPECRNTIETFQGSNPDAQEYHMLQTYSWQTWNQVNKKDPKTKEVTTTYEHNYAGDHWQLLEPSGRTRASKKLQFESVPASAASDASTAPRSTRSVDVGIDPRKLKFTSASAAETSTRPTDAVATVAPQNLKFGEAVPSAAPMRHAAASPVFTLCAATKDNGSPSVHFMLREVSGRKKFVRNPVPDTKSRMHNKLRMFTVTGMHFLEDYFGETFRIVYPSSVQQLLYAFPELDETNRSFFMSLGIGSDLDPYTLQQTFRSHALRLPKDSVDQSVIQTLKPGVVVNWRVLQWCWPPALDAFRIHVLDSNQMFVLQSPESHKKHDMILRFANQRYTLLHAVEGATAERLMRTVPWENLMLSHETHQKLQCQDMRTFDEFFDDKYFVSAALQGSEPSKDEIDSMWKHATEAEGLKYDERFEKWITKPAGLPPQTKSNTDGSLHSTSWKHLQQALLSALESDAASCDAPLRRRVR